MEEANKKTSANLNRLLKRQIRKHLSRKFEIPDDFLVFFNEISETYDAFEAERKLSNRTLELSSQELTQAYEKLKNQTEIEKENIVLVESEKSLKEYNQTMALINENLLLSEKRLQEEHQKVTDSINYAKRIQEAIFPSISVFKQVIPDSFIFLEPRDVVSGDFYWLYEQDDNIYFAVSDCTGHGVPGAFMSMIGINTLNWIISTRQASNPSDILNLLDYQIRTSLKSDHESRVNDGMDISIIKINKKEKTVQYSGARSPLLVIQNGKLQHIKPSRKSISDYFGLKIEFEEHLIELTPDTTLYMYTDGYQDQFGGARNHKLYPQPFRNLLLSCHRYPPSMQVDILKKKLKEWKGQTEQVDDITVAGLKFRFLF